MTSSDILQSFAGSAGQRCMAASVLLLVGQNNKLIDLIVSKARALRPGQSNPGEIGPVICAVALKRIIGAINNAEKSGAEILLDGRSWKRDGFWIGPTVILHNNPKDEALHLEIFGPVLSILRVNSLEEAMAIEAASPYGNAACVYTASGELAAKFAKTATAGMLGVNIGVPVPREPFSFGGTKLSKFGISDMTGDGGVEFFTVRRKVTTKWVTAKTNDIVASNFVRYFQVC